MRTCPPVLGVNVSLSNHGTHSSRQRWSLNPFYRQETWGPDIIKSASLGSLAGKPHLYSSILASPHLLVLVWKWLENQGFSALCCFSEAELAQLAKAVSFIFNFKIPTFPNCGLLWGAVTISPLSQRWRVRWATVAGRAVWPKTGRDRNDRGHGDGRCQPEPRVFEAQDPVLGGGNYEARGKCWKWESTNVAGFTQDFLG